ncbi:MAG: hypothetical protein MI725_09640, partial [Pirellulales bacterium]|nr:hypothetical protein [Pirellulales bacterium]
PNGYDDLLRAAEMLAPRTGFYNEMQPEELAAVVAQNQPALALAREGLKKGIGVTIDWSCNPAAGGDQAHFDNLPAMKKLSRAFLAQMQQKQDQQQTDSAIVDGLDMFRLGKQCYRGGLMVDLLVGIGVQSSTLHGLRQIAMQDATTRATLLKQLVPLLETGEPAEDVLQREIDYINSAARGYMGLIVRLNSEQLLGPTTQTARSAVLRSTAQQRLFVIHLALHVYREANDSWPSTLAALSPETLNEVPDDPYSKAPFVYRVEKDAYRLYSVGENKVDDNGQGDETSLGPDVVYDLSPSEQ